MKLELAQLIFNKIDEIKKIATGILVTHDGRSLAFILSFPRGVKTVKEFKDLYGHYLNSHLFATANSRGNKVLRVSAVDNPLRRRGIDLHGGFKFSHSKGCLVLSEAFTTNGLKVSNAFNNYYNELGNRMLKISHIDWGSYEVV